MPDAARTPLRKVSLRFIVVANTDSTKADICSSWQQVNKESWYQSCFSSLRHYVENYLSRRLIEITNTDTEDVQPYGRQPGCTFLPQNSDYLECIRLTDWLLEESPPIHRAPIEHPGFWFISSCSIISQNFHAVMLTCVETIRTCSDRSELRCSEGAFSMRQDSNFRKEVLNAYSSSHQAGTDVAGTKLVLLA